MHDRNDEKKLLHVILTIATSKSFVLAAYTCRSKKKEEEEKIKNIKEYNKKRITMFSFFTECSTSTSFYANV